MRWLMIKTFHATLYTPWKHQKTSGFQGIPKETSGMKWVKLCVSHKSSCFWIFNSMVILFCEFLETPRRDIWILPLEFSKICQMKKHLQTAVTGRSRFEWKLEIIMKRKMCFLVSVLFQYLLFNTGD